MAETQPSSHWVPAGTDAEPAQKVTDDMAKYSKTVKMGAGTGSVRAQQR